VAASVDLAGYPQGHVDSGRHTLAGDHVAVDNVSGVAHHGYVAAGF